MVIVIFAVIAAVILFLGLQWMTRRRAPTNAYRDTGPMVIDRSAPIVETYASPVFIEEPNPIAEVAGFVALEAVEDVVLGGLFGGMGDDGGGFDGGF